MKSNGRLLIFTLILIALATICKFFFGPRLGWSGFSPVIAIALFSGMIIKQKDWSFLLPIFALFFSDLLIEFLYRQELFPYAGLYSGQWKNYCILLVTTLIGWDLKGRSYKSLLFGAIAAPTVFFLLSNLNVWASNEVAYSQDFSGLLTCYAAALPFYKNALISTLIFLPVILFGYNYIMRNRMTLTLAKEQ